MDKMDYVSMIDRDFPDITPITERARKMVKKEGHRYRGSVRISNAMFFTDEEYNALHKKVMGKELP